MIRTRGRVAIEVSNALQPGWRASWPFWCWRQGWSWSTSVSCSLRSTLNMGNTKTSRFHSCSLSVATTGSALVVFVVFDLFLNLLLAQKQRLSIHFLGGVLSRPGGRKSSSEEQTMCFKGMLRPMASNLLAMASNILQPKS